MFVGLGGHIESLYLRVNVSVCVSKNKTLRQAALQICSLNTNIEFVTFYQAGHNLNVFLLRVCCAACSSAFYIYSPIFVNKDLLWNHTRL